MASTKTCRIGQLGALATSRREPPARVCRCRARCLPAPRQQLLARHGGDAERARRPGTPIRPSRRSFAIPEASGHLSLESGRRSEALRHFALAALHLRDGYRRADLAYDWRILREHVELGRRRLRIPPSDRARQRREMLGRAIPMRPGRPKRRLGWTGCHARSRPKTAIRRQSSHRHTVHSERSCPMSPS